MTTPPNGHRAMMASRIEPGDSLDYFPSPPWWGRLLGEVIEQLGLAKARPLTSSSCEEPACGEGHLAHGLADVFGRVIASDIHDYGRGFAVRDFLAFGLTPTRAPDWVATNPPFRDKTAAFIRRAVGRARVGTAMLLQLRLLEGVERHGLFRECGLYAVAVLPRAGSGVRKGLWKPRQSTATTYGWFIFLAPGAVPGWAGFDGEVRTILVDPHAADRLTRDSDMAFAGLLAPGSPQGHPARASMQGAAVRRERLHA